MGDAVTTLAYWACIPLLYIKKLQDSTPVSKHVGV